MATDRSTIHAIIEHNFYAKRHTESVIGNLHEVGVTALLLIDLYGCVTIGIHMKCSTIQTKHGKWFNFESFHLIFKYFWVIISGKYSIIFYMIQKNFNQNIFEKSFSTVFVSFDEFIYEKRLYENVIDSNAHT